MKLILYDSCTEMAVDMIEHHHQCLLHFCISGLNRSTEALRYGYKHPQTIFLVLTVYVVRYVCSNVM